MESPMLGMILAWPIDWAPMGWMFCEGQSLPINQYQALYSLLGVKFGGNATTTFNLPDLRGRMIMGSSLTTTTLGPIITTGTFGGTYDTMLTTAQTPQHNHTISSQFAVTNFNSTVSVAIPVSNGSVATTNTPDQTKVLGKAQSISGEDVNMYTSSADNTTLKPFYATLCTGQTMTLNGATAANAAPTQKVPTVSPFLAMRYIIAMEGLYPVRD